MRPSPCNRLLLADPGSPMAVCRRSHATPAVARSHPRWRSAGAVTRADPRLLAWPAGQVAASMLASASSHRSKASICAEPSPMPPPSWPASTPSASARLLWCSLTMRIGVLPSSPGAGNAGRLNPVARAAALKVGERAERPFDFRLRPIVRLPQLSRADRRSGRCLLQRRARGRARPHGEPSWPLHASFRPRSRRADKRSGCIQDRRNHGIAGRLAAQVSRRA